MDIFWNHTMRKYCVVPVLYETEQSVADYANAVVLCKDFPESSWVSPAKVFFNQVYFLAVFCFA